MSVLGLPPPAEPKAARRPSRSCTTTGCRCQRALLGESGEEQACASRWERTSTPTAPLESKSAQPSCAVAACKVAHSARAPAKRRMGCPARNTSGELGEGGRSPRARTHGTEPPFVPCWSGCLVRLLWAVRGGSGPRACGPGGRGARAGARSRGAAAHLRSLLGCSRDCLSA